MAFNLVRLKDLTIHYVKQNVDMEALKVSYFAFNDH